MHYGSDCSRIGYSEITCGGISYCRINCSRMSCRRISGAIFSYGGITWNSVIYCSGMNDSAEVDYVLKV